MVLRQSRAALAGALEGGRHLTRPELAQALERAGIDTGDTLRLTYLVMHAELEELICSGPRRGKQFTYALLEERVPPAPALERDEALAELARRYFASRGPATSHDFSWWSGLTVTDARRGAQAAGAALEQHTVDGETYWLAASAPPSGDASHTAHLLPNYDEFFIGFKDRGAILERVKVAKMFDRQGDDLSAHVIVVGGQVVGGWRRTLKAKSVVVELNPLVRLTAPEQRAVSAAAERYGAFLRLPVEVAHASA